MKHQRFEYFLYCWSLGFHCGGGLWDRDFSRAWAYDFKHEAVSAKRLYCRYAPKAVILTGVTTIKLVNGGGNEQQRQDG